jgi:acyl carrier protein
MIPAQFCRVADIPLTSSGKIDVRALVALLNSQQVDLKRSISKPANEIEEKLIELFQSTLNASSIGIDDNFFDVGGDSLKLTTLWYKINLVFPGQVGYADLFTLPTVASVSRKMRLFENLAMNVSNLKTYETFLVPYPVIEGHQNLFLVPPFSGIGFVYNQLVEELKGFVNLFLLFYPGIFSDKTFTSLENLIEEFTQCTIENSPSDPILLLGYSSGGHIAFEIAKRLDLKGRESKVYIVDTAVKTGAKTEYQDYQEDIESFIEEFRDMLHGDEQSVQFIERYRKIILSFATEWSTYTQTDGTLKSDCCVFAREVFLDQKQLWVNHVANNFELVLLPKGHHDRLFEMPENIKVIAQKIVSDISMSPVEKLNVVNNL